MPNETNDLPPPVNHVFVDYENVRELDPTIIGSKTVHLTLLLGAQKTKLDATVVEKLMEHAPTVELIRLKSAGRNALDFTLVYYLGRAVLADPGGYFHIVSKDTGYDPLIEHLRSKHIRVRRHDDFTMLTFSAVPKPSAPLSSVAVPAAKSPAKLSDSTSPPATAAVKSPSKAQAEPSRLEQLETRVLVHLRRPTTKRPGTRKKLASYLTAHLGNKITEPEVSRLIDHIAQAGNLVVNEKGAVTYHLSSP